MTMAHDQPADNGAPIFSDADEHAKMLEIIIGATRCQAAACAARFSFADHLANGPQSAEAIAQAEGLDPDATLRLMRACASFGLVTYDQQKGFSATPLLNTLRKDDPASMRDTVIAQVGRGFDLPRSLLHEAVRTGSPQADATLGSSLWAFYKKPEGKVEGGAFTQSMDLVSQAMAGEVVRLIDTSGTRLALHIGGASGTLVHALMQACPDLRGAVLDSDDVLPGAMKAAEVLGLQNRFQTYSGDFLTEVPAADLYLLKFILHDWTEEACLAILRNCRRAMAPGGRLAIIEVVLSDSIPIPLASVLDLTMMAVLGGRERSYEGYVDLLSRAGFEARSIAEIHATPYSIIEAVAA